MSATATAIAPRASRARMGNFGQDYSDEEMLAKLRECAAELGRTPGCKAFDRWMKFTAHQALELRFGSYAAACVAAGLEPNARPASEKAGVRQFDAAAYRRAYLRVRGITGDAPTMSSWSELRLTGEPTVHTVRRRYGGWTRFVDTMEAAA